MPLKQEKNWETIQSHPLFSRVIKGSFWSIIGSAISRGMMLLASVGVARLLGAQSFGEFGVIQITVGVFGIFAGFGLGVTATKFVAEFKITSPEKAGRIIGLLTIIALATGGVMSTVLFISAPYLAEKTLGAAHLSPVLKISMGLLFFNSLNGLQTGVLSGLEAFRTIARINFMTGLLSFPLILAGTYYLGLEGAIWGLVASTIFNCVLNNHELKIKAAHNAIPIRYTEHSKERYIVWQFCIPAVISGTISAPVTWACYAILVNQPDGYIEVGLYTAANKFQMLVTYAGSTLGSALLPILASKKTIQNEGFKRFNILISWILGFAVAIPLICFPEIIELIFGSQFAGQQACRTLILVMCFTCITLYRQGLTRAIIANGMMWWGLLDNMLWALILGISFFFLRNMGAIGLAASFLIAYGLNTIIFVPFYTRKALAPIGTMLSKEAFCIWGLLLSIATISYYQTSIVLRSALLIFGLFFLFIAFKRLSKTRDHGTDGTKIIKGESI